VRQQLREEEQSLSSYEADDSTVDDSKFTTSTLDYNTSATTNTFTLHDDDDDTTLFTADVLDHYHHDNDHDTTFTLPPPITTKQRVPSICFSPTTKISNHTPKPTWQEQKQQIQHCQKRNYSYFFNDSDLHDSSSSSKSLGSLDVSTSSLGSTTAFSNSSMEEQTFSPSLVLQVPYNFQRTTPRAVQARQQASQNSLAKRRKGSSGK
jgi:hypothetical protein